jgi:uncharacterized membrane protein YfcA
MPFFLIILKLRPESAVLTSMIIQTAGMGSGSVAYLKQKTVDIRLAGYLVLITLPGIGVGAYLTKVVSNVHMELALGILTLITVFFFVSAHEKYTDVGTDRAKPSQVAKYSWFVSLCSIASGMLSIGIGQWLIPIMRSKWALKMKVAVATSIVTIFATCLIGALTHLFLGAVADYGAVLWAVPGVLIGGQIGPRLSQRINDRLLKEIFIFLLTLVGIHLIYNSY